MKTITLKVGDILEVIKSCPFNAPIPLGGRVKIVDFSVENGGCRTKFYGCAPVVTYKGRRWYTDVKTLFKNYKKLGGK